MMKTTIKYSRAALIAAVISLSPLAFGQGAVATTTTTSSDGTVTQFSPDTVIIHSDSSTEPMRYSYSKSTTVVDQNGAPVDVSIIKTGVPVQVYYDRDGDQMVARRIVVQSAAAPADGGVIIKKTTTTTTTNGGQ